MKLARGLAVVALWGAIGCGFDGRGVVASSAEYELYRQTRVAPTLDARLRAAWDYLQRYPNGEFRSDVRAWFQPAEADYFVVAAPSRVRLRRYLAVLPNGPHAVAARARLAELEQAALVAKQKEAAVLERARAVGDRLEQADFARKQFLDLAAHWVQRLAEPQKSRPRALVDSEFVRVFQGEAPAAVCDAQRCVKQLTLSYSIPDAGKTSERVAVFDVILTFDGAMVLRGELMGPDLFSRLGEAAQRLAVPVDDGQRRAEAIGATEQLLAGVLEPHFPKSKCAGTPVSPVVLERVCEGVRVQVIAALEVGGEDRVVIELIPAPAPPPDERR
ncbi:MAG TPA: hypothetical protein VI197_14455 [Polyangiaceae bacterium]